MTKWSRIISAVDDVFKALADPTRRGVLDELYQRDGQTLSELEGRLPMTRFGVMKHLRVLEGAGLVVTQRRGREKLHFLNTVPIRLIHDRWVSKFAEPWAASLSGLKQHLEERRCRKSSRSTSRPTQSASGRPSPTTHRAAPIGSVSASPPTGPPARPMSPAALWSPTPIFQGENLEVDPPRRLVQSFNAQWSDDVKAAGTSRVTWLIEPIGDSCKLTVTHDHLRDDANEQVYGGWPQVLSGLKTLLETGEMLTTPGSLMYTRPSTD